MRTRPISVGLLSLVVVTIVGVAPTRSVSSSSQESPAFLFTVAKNYEPLAWMHGEGRFSADAKTFLQAAGGNHPLIPGFAASADPLSLTIKFMESRYRGAGAAVYGCARRYSFTENCFFDSESAQDPAQESAFGDTRSSSLQNYLRVLLKLTLRLAIINQFVAHLWLREIFVLPHGEQGNCASIFKEKQANALLAISR